MKEIEELLKKTFGEQVSVFSLLQLAPVVASALADVADGGKLEPETRATLQEGIDLVKQKINEATA